MFHSNTELLIDCWRAKKGGAALPPRARIDPVEFAALLPQVFIVERGEHGRWPLRLAGELIAAVHGPTLRGADLIGLWAPGHRAPLQRALEAALAAPDFLVVSADAATAEGDVRRLEILFAPISGPSGLADRLLGLYQPLTPRPGFGARGLGELHMRAIGGGEQRPRPRLAAVDGRQIA
ncbi:MAG TPA: PAS domain-containing protein [Caulobacteraceae bacterium]